MPKTKIPRVSVSLTLYFKDAPAEYRGLVQENWVFGKNEYVSLPAMIVIIARRIVEFYFHKIEHQLDNLNYDIDRAGKILQNTKLEENKEKKS